MLIRLSDSDHADRSCATDTPVSSPKHSKLDPHPHQLPSPYLRLSMHQSIHQSYRSINLFARACVRISQPCPQCAIAFHPLAFISLCTARVMPCSSTSPISRCRQHQAKSLALSQIVSSSIFSIPRSSLFLTHPGAQHHRKRAVDCRLGHGCSTSERSRRVSLRCRSRSGTRLPS